MHADAELISRFADIEVFDDTDIQVDPVTGLATMVNNPRVNDENLTVIHRGMTLAAVGFYGPQGRELRIPLARPDLNTLIETFSHRGKRITNYHDLHYNCESFCEERLAQLQTCTRQFDHDSFRKDIILQYNIIYILCMISLDSYLRCSMHL